jgi:hypothetical protein
MEILDAGMGANATTGPAINAVFGQDTMAGLGLSDDGVHGADAHAHAATDTFMGDGVGHGDQHSHKRVID